MDLARPAVSEPDQLVETHSAHVLMVGDRVFQWKKPLDLGFADFRTLASRELACREEVRLNRRLAPDVYLGVDVLRREDGTVREHVVVMRRLPAAARLGSLVVGGTDVHAAVHLLARLLADFHSRCATSARPETVAGPDRLRELWELGLDALAADAELLDREEVAEARSHVDAYVSGRGPLFSRRISSGQVRDGHGDLLADDIFCMPDGPRILDCLDFDPALRHGDVLGDMATLVMDLEHLGAPEAGEQLLHEYSEFSGEHHPSTLAHLYVAYRAQVRAKVALVRAGQVTDPASHAHEVQQARQLTRLMIEHLRLTRVVLVLVGGLPGSGKSTVADGLAAATGALVLSSDLVRHQLDLPLAVRYSPEAVNHVYEVLLERARAGLEQGWDVVIDASWADAGQRAAAARLAVQSHSSLLELRCDANDAIADRRLRNRPAGHPSDADPAVRRTMAAHDHPWPSATALLTNGHPADAVAAAVKARWGVNTSSSTRQDVNAEGRCPGTGPSTLSQARAPS